MNDSIYGAIGGAILTGGCGLFFSWIHSLKKNKEDVEQKTIDEILRTIKENQDRELNFKEEWGSLKNQVGSISVYAESLKDSAREIIIMRRDLTTAFQRIDEIRSLIKESNDYKSILNGRLYLLKKAVEDAGGKLNNDEWVDPRKENLL